MPEPDISGANVVLIGSFNPKIFQPEWFLRQNLLPESEAEEADIKVIHPEVCQFETERFVIQVTSERFIAASKASTNPEPLRDLVLGAFFILEHTPVTAMGLNRQMHFQMNSESEWNKIGDRLAPKEGWTGVLGDKPGMLSLIIQSDREGRLDPSLRLGSNHPVA